MPIIRYMLTPQQRRKLERQAKVDQYGGPPEHHNLAALAAATRIDFAVEQLWPRAMKYGHLNWIEVVNNDSVALMLYLNGTGGPQFYIPAGVSRPVNRMAFLNFSIENLDAATATTLGLVRIMAQRLPLDADEVARRSQV